MAPKEAKWRTYEQVATFLLNEIAAEFGLEKVEGKQKVLGLISGNEWEIDAKGLLEQGHKFMIVECRRYTKSKLDQERLGGLAFRIDDTQASGGIVVSPLGLQEGAEKVANAKNIISVNLDADSSSTDYIMKFLEQIRVGMSGELNSNGKLEKKVIRKDGTVEDLGCV